MAKIKVKFMADQVPDHIRKKVTDIVSEAITPYEPLVKLLGEMNVEFVKDEGYDIFEIYQRTPWPEEK